MSPYASKHGPLVDVVFSVYESLTAAAGIVGTYKSLPNLLIWETAHEPDGNSDPFNAAQNTYDLIYQVDGYNPVSVVLNCENYSILWHNA